MKKLLLIILSIFTLILTSTIASAQGMPALSGAERMGFPSSSSDSATIQSQQQEEREGKQFLDNLNNKIVTCSQLKDADFEKIGEYFMGQSIGDTVRHIAMNEMMKSMMGEQGEEQMHIAVGKRMSNCDPNALMPQNMMNGGMMRMMMGGGGNPMMGWVTMIAFWLLILGVIALIRYISGLGRSSGKDKNPLDILRERYARGEIDKKEFEEMKKDLR